MSTGRAERPAGSLVSRLLGRPRPRWITVGFGFLLILAPIGVAYLDGVLQDLVSQGQWRPLLLPSAVIIYIVAVTPALTRGETDAIKAFRPVVLMDDDSFNRLVSEASRPNLISEMVALGVGAAFGLWTGQASVSDASVFWLRLWLSVSSALMFGLLAWVLYSAVAASRLTARLHRQPLRIDIFDTEPFQPIGRQSLIIALVFVGGIALSMVFGLQRGSIFAWENWVLYILVMLVPIVVFFLNMRDTHGVLAAAKNRELEAVEQNIRQASRTLMKRIAAKESTGTLAAEINALVAYEGRVRAARTWPYETGMLRTLFFSIIIPGGAAVAQAIFEVLF